MDPVAEIPAIFACTSPAGVVGVVGVVVVGLVMVTVGADATTEWAEIGLTAQVNEALPEAPVVSSAVTVTLEVSAVVGVPVIRPLEELIERPAGRPVAL